MKRISDADWNALMVAEVWRKYLAEVGMNERDPDWREVLRESLRPVKTWKANEVKRERSEIAQKVIENEWRRQHGPRSKAAKERQDERKNTQGED